MYPMEDLNIDLYDKPRIPKFFIVIGVVLLLFLSIGTGMGAAAYLEEKQANQNGAPNEYVQESVTSKSEETTEQESIAATESAEQMENDSTESTSQESSTSENANTNEVSSENTGNSQAGSEPIATLEPVTELIDGHLYTIVSEQVTAKELTNLRNIPSQGEGSQVLVALENGQIATRTAISDHGWSRVEYQGKTYYAVSSLLTTDVTPKTP